MVLGKDTISSKIVVECGLLGCDDDAACSDKNGIGVFERLAREGFRVFVLAAVLIMLIEKGLPYKNAKTGIGMLFHTAALEYLLFERFE